MKPWCKPELVRLIAFVAAGGVMVVVAWNGAATRSRLDDQTGWISLGVAGLAASVVAQTLWLRRGRRALAGHAARIRGDVASLVGSGSHRPALMSTPDGLVAAEGMRHYHRPECPIARGQRWGPVPRRAHEAAGRTPCGICTP